MNRAAHEEALFQALEVEDPRGDGTRWISLLGVVLGKLRQDSETGNWSYEFRSHSEGWHPGVTELEGVDSEKAELWAAEEVAGMLAIEREALARYE